MRTEAERRIEEARRTRAESLDLRDLTLSELPASLGDLPHLERLDLESTGITDLTPLAGNQGLRDLSLKSCQSLVDLYPLKKLPRLRELNLFRCRPAPSAALLRDLAGKPRLRRLVIDGAVGVPREILTEDGNDPFDATDNCLPRLRAYLAEVALGAEPTG